MPYRDGTPKRDRGIYRAAANPKNPHHSFAVGLIAGLSTISGLLRWLYRGERFGDLVYSTNYFLRTVGNEFDRDGSK